MMLSVLILAAAVTVSNKVVFVDQENKINAPEVVASVADMTSNRTAIAIAQAAADTAETAARKAQSMIDTTVSSIVANELVIYRQGFTDSLGVMVVLPPDTRCLVTSFKPNIATDGKGNVQHELVYATTADASAVPPEIKHASTLAGPGQTTEFKVLDVDFDKTNLSTSFEDKNGTVYNYMYSLKFWMPEDKKGFYIVYLDADAASGDGMTFDISGGITGGYTGDVVVGADKLSFKGGLLMEVKPNE